MAFARRVPLRSAPSTMDSPQELARAAAAFRARATRGDLSGANRLLAALAAAADRAPLARAWEQAVRAQVWLAFPEAVAPPRNDELEALATAPEEARRAAAFAARDLAWAAFLAFDWGDLATSIERLRRLVTDEGGEIDLAIAGALGALARGEAVAASFDGMLPRAARAGQAAAVVEVQAIRAALALEAGDSPAGLELARRSSLMARAEGIPEAELLAGLLLARARRYNSQAHVAEKVVEVLAAAVTAPWRPWLAWEAVLSGGNTAAAVASRGPPRDLARLIEAARRGDRQQFRARHDELVARLGSGLFGREAADLAAALDPRLEAGGTGVRAWRLGELDLVPPAVAGLALELDPEAEETAAAYVLLLPGDRGVRFLHLGLSLVVAPPADASESGPGDGSGHAAELAPDLTRLRQSRRPAGRVETLLAVLALAGPEGLPESECFARAYGFGYVAEVHRGVFDVLLHRARAAIHGFASVDRTGGRVTLAPERALLLPDPRVCQRTTDRVLRLLARHGPASAKQAASELGVSLRAAQAALSDLAARHACIVERQGRHLCYAVEDTVLSKVTLRLNAAQLSVEGGSSP